MFIFKIVNITVLNKVNAVGDGEQQHISPMRTQHRIKQLSARETGEW